MLGAGTALPVFNINHLGSPVLLDHNRVAEGQVNVALDNGVDIGSGDVIEEWLFGDDADEIEVSDTEAGPNVHELTAVLRTAAEPASGWTMLSAAAAFCPPTIKACAGIGGSGETCAR